MAEISVKIDIAGMYYDRVVKIEEGATVKDAMLAATQLDESGMSPDRRKLSFNVETGSEGKEFIDGISVRHIDPAESRQDKNRKYSAGLYTYHDDAVETKPDGSFEPKDPCRPYVLTWQYYVYDENGVDQDRRHLNSKRTVVPFSDQQLTFNCTVVWRLIAIFLRPTYGDSLKVARAKQAAAPFV